MTKYSNVNYNICDQCHWKRMCDDHGRLAVERRDSASDRIAAPRCEWFAKNGPNDRKPLPLKSRHQFSVHHTIGLPTVSVKGHGQGWTGEFLRDRLP